MHEKMANSPFVSIIHEVLGRTNLPTFPMAMVAIATLVKDHVM
jgi:hypothetical protein